MVIHRRRMLCAILSIATILPTRGLASAQDKAETRSRRTVTTTEWPSLRGVLAVDDVRSLLNLTEEENDEIRLFIRGERSRRGGRGDDGGGPPPDAPLWQVELFRQERRLKRILGDERYTRIRQLQAQAGGLPAAFTRDDPGFRLEVTTEQRDRARKEIRAAAEQMHDRFVAVPRDRYEEQARLRTELYETLTPPLTDLLTDVQKEKWAEMTGEPGDPALILTIRSLGGR